MNQNCSLFVFLLSHTPADLEPFHLHYHWLLALEAEETRGVFPPQSLGELRAIKKLVVTQASALGVRVEGAGVTWDLVGNCGPQSPSGVIWKGPPHSPDNQKLLLGVVVSELWPVTLCYFCISWEAIRRFS